MKQAQVANSLSPRLVWLDASAVSWLPVLKGPPETVTMRSGYVILRPCESVVRHSTGGNEELLVVLAGTGEMRFLAHESLNLVAPCAA